MRISAIIAAISMSAGAFAARATPDFTGFWRITNHAVMLKTVDGRLPPLLPDALGIYQHNIRDRSSGNLAFDQTEICRGPGVPRELYIGNAFQWLQSPKSVYLIYQWNHEARLVDVGISHGQQNMYAPLYFGFSVGKWEGDAFVIDSVDFNDSSILDAAGLPHSDALHVIERYKLIDGGTKLQARITIDDPKTYARPWETDTIFSRLPDNTVMQDDICVLRKHLNARAAADN